MVKRLQLVVSKRLAGDSFGANVARLLTGTALVQGLNLLISPILSRLYTPGDFGSLAVFTSILSVLAVASCLGFEKSIPLPQEDGLGAASLMLSLVAGFVSSVAVALIIFPLGGWIVQTFDVPEIKPYLWLLPLSLFGLSTYQALSQWATRRQAFGLIAKTKVTQGLSQALGQLGLGFALKGPLGLIVGDTLGRVGGSGTFAIRALREDKAVLLSVRWPDLKKVVRRFGGFAFFSSWAGFLHLAATAFAPLLFASLYSKEVSGFYNLGQKAIWNPMVVLSGAMAQVFVGRAAAAYRDDKSQLAGLFDRTAKRLFLIGIGPMAILTLIGGPLFAWVFGPEWREAGVYMQIIAFTQLAQFAVGPVFQVLSILEKPRLILVCDAIGFIVIVGGVWSARLLDLNARWAVATYGVGTIILYGCLFFVSRKAVREVAI